MSTIPAPPDVRSASPGDVVQLQFANRNKLLGVPLYILGGVAVFSVLVSLAILRAGGRIDDGSFNSGVVWSLAGYHVALGVQNVTSSFPFALALGSTRRSFALGNLTTSLAVSAYVTLVGLALLGLETVTGGFFMGAHVFRVASLGDGTPSGFAATLFLGLLTALSIGGVFGAAWIRFGALGPTLLGIGLSIALAITLLLLLPQIETGLASFRTWWLAVAAGIVIVLSTAGEYLLLRRATVR